MLIVYKFLTIIFYPLLILLIYFRVLIKKEHNLRYKEKLFSRHFNIVKNYKKKLIWFHVASIGELQSILPLVNKTTKAYSNIEILITTVTLSSYGLLEKKLAELPNVKHRFFPLDINFLTISFLEKWKPDLVCFVDSEIWPNFLTNIKIKKIPLVLLNGRITKKTYKRWKKIPIFASQIFNSFNLCLASSKESEKNLKLLRAKNIIFVGNLKFTYEINNKINLNDNTNIHLLKNYNVWCAASTHPGEEQFIIKTHLLLEKKIKSFKTIIVPRHIYRSEKIKNICKNFNLKYQILSNENKIDLNADVFIINSYGTLQKYYNLCSIVFVGKSLIPKLKHVGGQNPIEPAKYGCKIFHGPYVYNFEEIYEKLANQAISQEINNEYELAERLENNFLMPRANNKDSVKLLNDYGNKIIEETFKKISHYVK